ncbi:MAG: hypothetical protein B7X04_02840 [Parcubacteria group bacterium 21-54-25]|nr:MAG: hypothetical protein B7X04_02840 [Parcubacteria group bacterium 21-54-25]HQU07898.1 hypothetical protein [Candidatus Paceibacterota bacterium]
MSFRFRPNPSDWLLSDKILNEADREIVANAKVHSEFDVPYVAGYSVDGERFYIDRNLPKSFQHEGRPFVVRTTLILHEVVEKALEKEAAGIPYQLAHQIALRAERAAAEAANISWDVYNNWFDTQIKEIGSRDRYDNCPPDLDLQPYLDERDWSTLEKMYANGKPLWNGKKS